MLRATRLYRRLGQHRAIWFLLATLAVGSMDGRIQSDRKADDDARHPVWVFFRDRSLSPEDMQAALMRADAGLTPRARARRAKTAPDRRILADEHDLPLDADALAAVMRTGATLRHRSRWLNAASFDASPEQRRMIARLDDVARIEAVRQGRRAANPMPIFPADFATDPSLAQKAGDSPFDYGTNAAAMAQANVPPLHALGYTGRGVLVGMLDTGFSALHECLDHIPVLATWDFINNDFDVDNDGDDSAAQIDHGTMTLSTLAGFHPGGLVAPAPQVTVVLAKLWNLFDESPPGEYVPGTEEDRWVTALAWAESLGVDIVSSSVVYIEEYTFEDLDGDTAVCTVAADLASERGMLVVNSAGNYASTLGMILAPSDGHQVLAIGAVKIDGIRATFSSPGPTADGRIKPDVMALGVGNTVADPEDPHAYRAVSGTSFSCPLVAGVAALMLERNPGLTVAQIGEALRATADHADAPDNYYGWGIVDAYAAATWFGPNIAHQPLADLTDDPGPPVIQATVTDRQGLVPGEVRVVWRLNDGGWQDLAMAPAGSDTTFVATLPALDLFDTVEYYLQATGSGAFVQTDPVFAPEDLHRQHRTSWTTTDFAAYPDADIPDASLVGTCAVFTVPYTDSGRVSGLSVEIAVDHPLPEQLQVVLTGPTGIDVMLHDQGAIPALVGTWPTTLTVDGPGALQDFHDLINVGEWSLRVSDSVSGDVGRLLSAALHFTVYDFVTAVPGDGPLPAADLSLTVAPNPFNPATRISFSLDQPAHARLAVYDLRGRQVRGLLDADLESGSHAVRWDGRDNGGRAVGSGVYLYRLDAGQRQASGRMSLVR